MKKGYIYKITSPSGKIYIGQTINLKNRLYLYKGHHCKKQIILYNSLLKYGWDKHIFEIIEEIEYVNNDISLLNEREKFWIKEYNSLANPFSEGMNLTEGGNSGLRSDETKMRMSQSQKGKIISNETKMKISKSNIGKKHSEETKRKMSERQTGRKHKEESKEKVRLSKKGIKLKESHKLNCSKSKKNKKSVEIYGIIYHSIGYASKVLGIPETTLKRKLKSDKFPDFKIKMETF